MIDLKHHEALKSNNAKLNKDVVKANALITHYQKEFKEYKEKVETKLGSTINMYDRCAAKAVEYLIENKLIKKDSKEHVDIVQMFPLKLG